MIKPKFNVGDKIVFVGKANTISHCIGNVYEIIDVLEKGYECKHEFYIPFTEQNNYRSLNGAEFKQRYFILTWEQCKNIYDEHKDEIYLIDDGELFAVPCELYFLNHI